MKLVIRSEQTRLAETEEDQWSNQGGTGDNLQGGSRSGMGEPRLRHRGARQLGWDATNARLRS